MSRTEKKFQHMAVHFKLIAFGFSGSQLRMRKLHPWLDNCQIKPHWCNVNVTRWLNRRCSRPWLALRRWHMANQLLPTHLSICLLCVVVGTAAPGSREQTLG